MSNYPAGAKNDSNAPYNKEQQLQGETIGLFEYLENLEMPYQVRCELKSFDKNRITAYQFLTILSSNLSVLDNRQIKLEIVKIKRLVLEPQIFIENE